MVPKSVKRFSDNILLTNNERMMPKGVKQISDKHHAQEKRAQ